MDQNVVCVTRLAAINCITTASTGAQNPRPVTQGVMWFGLAARSVGGCAHEFWARFRRLGCRCSGAVITQPNMTAARNSIFCIGPASAITPLAVLAIGHGKTGFNVVQLNRCQHCGAMLGKIRRPSR